MRFSLIDRILHYEEGRGIHAAKGLSQAEEYLMDHFPGYPVMPGVLMVEAMTQAASWYVRIAEDFRHPVVTLQEATHVRFGRFVNPGDTLLVDMQLADHDRATGQASFRGQGRILSLAQRNGGRGAEEDGGAKLPVACRARMRVAGSPVTSVLSDVSADTAGRIESRLRDSQRQELASLGFTIAEGGAHSAPAKGGAG